jgi:hypothetical protein
MNWIKLETEEPNDGDRCLVCAEEWHDVLTATWVCDDNGIYWSHETYDVKYHKILRSDATMYWVPLPTLPKD